MADDANDDKMARLRGTPQFGKAYNSVLLVAWAAFDTEWYVIKLLVEET